MSVLPKAFDLDRYLDALASYLLESFRRWVAGRTLYELLTNKQVRLIPVTLHPEGAGEDI